MATVKKSKAAVEEKFTLEPRHDEEDARKVRLTITPDEQGTGGCELALTGLGPGLHAFEGRLDRSGEAGHGQYDERITVSFDGDTHTLSLPFTPKGGIVAVDGSDEIRFGEAKEQ